MRVSRAMRDTAYKVLQAKEAYMAEHQREPTVDEIARMLELKREDVVFALDAIVDPVSLYEPVYSDSGDTICVMDQVRDSKTRTRTGWSRSHCGKPLPSCRTGRSASCPSVFSGKDPDGGVHRGGDLPGPGVPPGEERPAPDQKDL